MTAVVSTLRDMNVLVVSICITVVAVLGGSDGIIWTEESTREGAVIQTCLGEEVSLPWQYITETDETVVNVEWYKNSEGAETILATFNGGQFFTSPVTHLKLSLLFNAGLQVANLTWANYGTYSVRVKVVQNGGQLRSISREAVISPPDAPILAAGRLVAQKVSEPVTDNVTGELHVQLKCGTFLALGSSPVSVVWKTPSGQTVTSTEKSADSFFLTLPNPIEGGNYFCHLENDTALQACVKNAQSMSSLKRGAFVQLDEVETQLSILGAQAKTLFSRDQDLRSSLKKEVNLLRQDLHQCNDAGDALTSKVSELRQEQSEREKTEKDLQIQVEVLNTSTYSQVSKLRKELSEREKTEKELQRQVEVLNTSTHDLRSTLALKEAAYTQLTEQMGRVTDQLHEIRSTYDELRSEFGKQQSKIVTICPGGWNAFQKSCYGVGTELVTWGDAQELCGVHGGHLAEIDNSAENDFVKGIIRPKRYRSVWLGAVDVFADGHWVWASDGQPLNFSDWQPGEQTANWNGSEDCLSMFVEKNYRWTDKWCSYTGYFVCEIRLS